MSFLQQPLLWGLLAASIPIIIHLLNRRRHKTVQWAAMEFLLKATRESRGKKKLKYLIILACRTLAIAALIFAIARPLIGDFFGWGSSRIDTVILVLDRSSSMEQQTSGSRESKRQSAIASVRKSLTQLNNPRLVLIDSASGKAQDVPSPDVLEELTSTTATDTRSSIPTLISTAIDYVIDKAPGRTEIWVASDMQVSDWAPTQGRWEAIKAGIKDLPQKTTLRILSLPSPPKNNAAIRVLSSRRKGNNLILSIEIIRSESETPTTIPITFDINGARTADKVTLNGQRYQFERRLPLGEAKGNGYGYVSLPSDTNTRDNVSFFAYGDDLPTETYIVSDNNEAADWLAMASAPPGFDKSKSTTLSPANAHEINWLNTSLVIWQAPLPEGGIAEGFTQFLQNGGAALFMPPSSDSNNAFLGINWGERTTSPRGQYFIIPNWNKTDGPLRNGLEGTPIAVPKLKAINRRDIQGESTVLASWDDEKPFLIRRIVGDGTAIFAGTITDYTWSNLADADVLLPLVQRMIAVGDNRFGSAFAAIAGTQKAQVNEGEIRTRLDNHSKSNSTNAPYEAGVWKLGDRLIATNRPKSEDQWQILTPNKLNLLLEDTPFKLFEDKGQSDALAQEIWRAFLIAMLVFLITEAILCLQPKTSRSKS